MTRDSAWLEETFEALDRVIFLGALAARGFQAKWMRYRRNKHEFVYGRCDIDRRRIELNPVMRHAWVPDIVLLDVMHHEACHVVLGAEHDHAFKLAERSFIHHVDSEKWCQENFDRLLEAAPPRKDVAC